MRLNAAIAVGLGLSAMASNASAASFFDLFKALCIDTVAEPAAAIAVADELKWGRPSSQLVRALTKPSGPGEVVTGVEARGASDLRGTLTVAVAETNRMITKRNIPARACVLVAGPSMDVNAISREAAAYATVPGQAGLVTQKSAISYLWREADGRRVPLSPDGVPSAPASEVRMMVVMAGQQTSVMQFFVPIAGQN